MVLLQLGDVAGDRVKTSLLVLGLHLLALDPGAERAEADHRNRNQLLGIGVILLGLSPEPDVDALGRILQIFSQLKKNLNKLRPQSSEE